MCCAHGSVVVVRPPRLRPREEVGTRAIGIDVGRDFCEVAIAEAGQVRSAGRFATVPEEIEAFARTLTADDQVTLEATGNALAIARILEGHARVVLANPRAVKGVTALRTKTDKTDARTLATLLAVGFLPEVWIVDEASRVLCRRISRRAHLVRQRTRVKNQVHAVPDPQPQRAAAHERRVREPGPSLVGRTAPADR